MVDVFCKLVGENSLDHFNGLYSINILNLEWFDHKPGHHKAFPPKKELQVITRTLEEATYQVKARVLDPSDSVNDTTEIHKSGSIMIYQNGQYVVPNFSFFR